MSKRIVIIGGMGPQASLLLHNRIVDRAAMNGATEGDEFPEVIHASLPITDFISDGSAANDAVKQINEATGRLLLGTEQVVIACNTVHLFVEQLDPLIQSELVSLVAITVKRLTDDKVKSVGILASPTTIRNGLYEKALTTAGIEVILPTNDEQAEIEKAIRLVIGGQATSKESLTIITQRMADAGAQKILLGCTELSVLFQDANNDRFIDPLSIVVDQLLGVQP